MPASFKAFFAHVRPGPLGRRLCLWHAPADAPPKSLIVHIHGFAEEMNKSRRMAALQSRTLAASGHAVLQMDLLGCGDSAGDFGDVTWQAWIEDVVGAAAIAADHHARTWPGVARPDFWLWGHRCGCLLASAASARMEGGCNFLFWQPTPSGKSVLQQFLRLQAAGALLGKAAASSGTSAREVLAAGGTAEVAGYRLAPGLSEGLEAARLQPPAAVAGRPLRLEWIDVAPQLQTSPAPAAAQAIAAWTSAGYTVRHRSVAGPAFWQTTEVEDAPALVDATLAALCADRRDAAGPSTTEMPADPRATVPA